jgi:hypothetical protein
MTDSYIDLSLESQNLKIKLVDNGDGTYSLGNTTVLTTTVDADFTQLITVTTSGVPVQGPNKESSGGWFLKADPTNTGNVWYMYHGQTKALKGFPLGVGETGIADVLNLNMLDFDSDYNAGKIHASKI